MMHVRWTTFQMRTAIKHTTATVFLLTLGTSGLAAEVPKDLLGTWSTDKGCNLDAGPDEAFIYTFTPKYISFYEIECLIKDVRPGRDKVEFHLDCFKGGGSRYFDKLHVQRLPRDRLALTFQNHSDSIYRCSRNVSERERLPGEKVTKWRHNDSVVSFTETGDGVGKALEINYVQPRPGLILV